MKTRLIAFLMILFILITCVSTSSYADEVTPQFESTGHSAKDFGSLLNVSKSFIVVKHKQLGGSHYAYTEAVSDEGSGSPMGNEINFIPGSQMVLLTLDTVGGIVHKSEEILLESKTGVIRDPDVSEDGENVLFSWKQASKDDFHLYTMNLETKKVTQLTFGSGIADIEPKYLPGGKIVFTSTRCIEYVDCWHTTVANNYICNGDGTNILRLGYDQVHTTYPTVTDDGRIIYTRWDYNDRTQMYIQGVFQMFADGTNQTEVFGNNSSFPTTLLHTRDVPENPGLYVSISSGHHTYQAGKMVLVDTSIGRNNKDSVSFVFPDSTSSKKDNEDGQNQDGPIYKFPIALNDHEFLVSYCQKGWSSDRRSTPFGIYYMNSKTNEKILLSAPTEKYGASQIAIIKTRKLFERPSMVNHAVQTGTFYMANVYEGLGLKDVETGVAKYMRVVGLEFRSSAIGATIGNGTGSSDQFSPIATGNGAWDIKHVLGIVELEEDGSAMFKVPANTPLYFQVLNADGELIQSMRSWSTLMPNEVFSCIGCHEDKNTVPSAAATTTLAMKKGVQTLKPDLWMDIEHPELYNSNTDPKGFSYNEVVQPILDNNCISCHNNTTAALAQVGGKLSESADKSGVLIKEDSLVILKESEEWSYKTSKTNGDWFATDYDDSAWKTGRAPFGGNQATDWSSKNIYIRRTFTVDNLSEIENKEIILKIFYDESPEIYLNGELIYSENGYLTNYAENIVTKEFLKHVKQGKNVIAVSAINTSGGQIIDLGFYASEKDTSPSADNPISLEGLAVEGKRERFNYALSYLVLTASKSNGNQFQGKSVNSYTSWISSMSQAEILRPYEFGSTQSPVIERLKSGHGGLSDKEIMAIAAWIDLGVPFRGSYNEAVTWSASDYKEYYEKLNKRTFYDSIDSANKQILTARYDTDSLSFTLSCNDGEGELKSVTGSGVLELNLDEKLSAGKTVTVKLPEGVKYFFLQLNPRIAESLIYCPSGEYSYEIPSFTKSIFPSTLTAAAYPVITARLASEKDLAASRNLALNAYDLTENTESFPHASASNVYNNDESPEFSARNAIDGFKTNLGHGTYPKQSWGPEQNPAGLWFNVDFGTEVYASSIGITIRADFPHDTHFTKAILEFSDGSDPQEITLTQTSATQVFEIEGGVRKTSFVKISGFEKYNSEWAALAEVEVFGTINEILPPVLEGIKFTPLDETAEKLNWDKEFFGSVFEYNINIKVKDDLQSVKISDIKALNTTSVIIKVDGNDVFYNDISGLNFDVASKAPTVVNVVLTGEGGAVSYKFTFTPSGRGSAVVIIIVTVAATAAFAVAGLFVWKSIRKKGPASAETAEIRQD